MIKYLILGLVALIVLNLFVFRIVFKPSRVKQLKKKYDCIIVCGYPANVDGSISEIMKTRVIKAIQLYQDNKSDVIIFSGGSVHNQFVEADIMADYAKIYKIEEKRIIRETRAISTYHNLLYCKRIMNKYSFSSCLVVTNGWHLRKANHYARKNNLDYVMVKADNPIQYSRIKVLYLYFYTNFHMYINMFKGYY